MKMKETEAIAERGDELHLSACYSVVGPKWGLKDCRLILHSCYQQLSRPLLHPIRGSDKDLLSRQGPKSPAISGYEILLTGVLFTRVPWSGSKVNASPSDAKTVCTRIIIR